MHASAIEATAALAGIAAVAGASSRQIIGGVVPKKMTRVADRSYYGPWSAKGLNLPATWSVTPGGAARRRDREVRGLRAAVEPPLHLSRAQGRDPDRSRSAVAYSST